MARVLKVQENSTPYTREKPTGLTAAYGSRHELVIESVAISIHGLV